MDATPRPSCPRPTPARSPRSPRSNGTGSPRGRSTATSLVAATLLVSGLLVGAGGGAATAGPRTPSAGPATATATTTATSVARPDTGATRNGQGQGKKPAPTATTASPTPTASTVSPGPTASTASPTVAAPSATAAPTAAPSSTAPSTTAPSTTAPSTTAPLITAPSTTAPVPPPSTTTAPSTSPAPSPTTSATPTATPAVGGARTTLPLPRSGWTRPVLVDPLVWRPSATNTILKNAGDRDVLVVWPSTPLDVEGGFQINGGRNVLSIGGTIQPSRRYFAPGETTPNDNRCLYIGGSSTPKAPRTVHVEGLHCAGTFVWEGINIDSKAERGTLTVQLRDVRIDQVNVDLPGGLGNHFGGDALQTWNGPHQLRIDGLTAKKLHYQGLFLQPFTFGSGALGRWDLRNIQLEGAAAGSAYLLWLSDSTSTPLAYGMEGTYVQPSPGDTRGTTIWHHTTDFTAAALGAPVEDIVGFAHVGPFAGAG